MEALRIISCTVMLAMAVRGGAQRPYTFDNLGGTTEHLCVRSITQTTDGRMWLAAESGLYSYDGHTLHEWPYIDENGEKVHGLGSFNCIASHGGQLLIGCNAGVLRFDTSTGAFDRADYANGEIVAGIVDNGGSTWVATDKSLYRDERRVENGISGLVSIGKVHDDIYFATTEATYKLKTSDGSTTKIDKGGTYATAFLPHADDVAIGSLNELRHERSGRATPMPVVKALFCTEDGSLLVGTDDGLFVCLEDGTTIRIEHEARDKSSLAGNVVWDIFGDRDGNVWIGTNHGVSMIRNERRTATYTLPSVTGRGDGNQIVSIIVDSKHRLWLGGTDGLIVIENLGKAGQSHRWYRMDDRAHPIPHNRVRCIMEDSHGRIIVGGDMGLLVHDETTEQMRRYVIPDDAHNWVYAISEVSDSLYEVTTFSSTYIVKLDEETLTAVVETTMSKKANSAQKGESRKLLARLGMEGLYDVAYADTASGRIILGGYDKFAILNDTTGMMAKRTTYFTSVTVDNDKSIAMTPASDAQIELGCDAKFFEVTFSDFDYAQESGAQYSYSMDDGAWIPVNCNDYALTLDVPGYGSHSLRLRSDTGVESRLYINVEWPWHHSPAAMAAYVLLAIGVGVAVASGLKARKKERELTQENEHLTTQLRVRAMQEAGDASEMSDDEKLLQKVIRIIEEGMDDSGFNVDALSKRSGISTKQLYRKIKDMTGLTTVAYIRRLRMQKAAALLDKGAHSVSEVMYMVGYANPSYFSRSFTDEFGMPPSEYAQSAAKKFRMN